MKRVSLGLILAVAAAVTVSFGEETEEVGKEAKKKEPETIFSTVSARKKKEKAKGRRGMEKGGSKFVKSTSKFIPEASKREHYLIRILVEFDDDGPSKKERDSLIWSDLKGKHFVVLFADAKKSVMSDLSVRLEGEKAFARKVLRNAERYYNRIAKTLGFARRTGFWTWENRVRIFVYPSNPSYMKDASRPKWSRGMTDYNARTITGYHTWREDEFLDEILPHELTHLIFRDFVGFGGEISLWLDEGVAQLLEREGKKRIESRWLAKELEWKKRLLPIRDLVVVTSFRLRHEMSTRAVREFYVQSLSLVDFMIEKYGSTRFEKFCRQLKMGKRLDGALKSTYPSSLKTLENLQKRWHQFLREDVTKREEEEE